MIKTYPNRIEWRNRKGELHRVDGPAIEWCNGMESWFLNGHHFVSEQEWFKALAEKDQVAYLFNIGFKNDN